MNPGVASMTFHLHAAVQVSVRHPLHGLTAMRWINTSWLAALICGLAANIVVQAAPLEQPVNIWVKRVPLADTPVSPRLGYEGALVWDNKHRVIIRYGGHN